MIGIPEHIETYIKAGVVLHNMLIREDSRFYRENQKLPDHFDENGVLIEGSWRTGNSMTSMFRYIILRKSSYNTISHIIKYVISELRPRK